MSNLMAGCGDGGEAPIAITIASDQAPALVAFRDGLDGEWQTATMKTPTSFEADVHGPYVITAACEDVAGGKFTTWQVARTPEDDRQVVLQCEPASPSTHAVKGQMAQAGLVQIGEGSDSSTTPGWDFEIDVRSGTYDLMARTADRIVLRRAIAVTGDVELTPAIDVDQDGTALAAVAFTATNAAATETLTAAVELDRSAPAIPFEIYEGPIATAKAVPDSALAATDTQRVSLLATAGNQTRAVKRSFRVGGASAYTLPAPLTGVEWKQLDGNLSVSWGSLPELDSFVVSLSGASADGTKHQRHELDLSPRFLQATGITRASVDTAIAGYKPEWKIDLTREHTRELSVQRAANGELATNRLSEIVAAAMVAPAGR